LELLLRVHLRGGARAGLLLREAVALDDSIELDLGRAVDHHDAVVGAVEAGLDEQRRVGDRDAALAGVGKELDQVRLFLADQRVQDRFERGAPLGIGEDDAAESGAIDAAIRIQDLLAEDPGHRLVGGARSRPGDGRSRRRPGWWHPEWRRCAPRWTCRWRSRR